jgi:hypothetical protein
MREGAEIVRRQGFFELRAPDVSFGTGRFLAVDELEMLQIANGVIYPAVQVKEARGREIQASEAYQVERSVFYCMICGGWKKRGQSRSKADLIRHCEMSRPCGVWRRTSLYVASMQTGVVRTALAPEDKKFLFVMHGIQYHISQIGMADQGIMPRLLEIKMPNEKEVRRMILDIADDQRRYIHDVLIPAAMTLTLQSDTTTLRGIDSMQGLILKGFDAVTGKRWDVRVGLTKLVGNSRGAIQQFLVIDAVREAFGFDKLNGFVGDGEPARTR